MDSFESLVGSLLEREGYWTRSSVKVELTAAEKKRIGRPSSPRWELDLVAYKAKSNELLVVECKSYLDSPGVRFGGLDGSQPKEAKRYKLFNERVLRQTVLQRLVKQLVSSGACAPRPTVTLCLAAGNIASEPDQADIKKLFDRNGWQLFDSSWLEERLRRISNSGYENEVATVVAKLLLRASSKQNSSRRNGTT